MSDISDMTKTEVLRSLLDEQGIEYREYQPNPSEEITAWDLDVSDIRHEVWASFQEFDRGATLLKFWNCTPEQAIEATLGRGTCKMEYVSDFMSWHCKACDMMAMAPRNPKPRFCKWCGRKVVTDG